MSVSQYLTPSGQVLLVVRIVQLLLVILVLALSAATISKTPFGYVSEDAFALFVSIWSLLNLAYFYFSPKYLPVIAHPLGFFAAELLLQVFWFCAWIALAAVRGPGGCNYYGFFFTDDEDWSSSCKTGKANIAFSCFTWISFVVTTVYVVVSAVPYFRNKGYETTERGIPGGILPSGEHVLQQTPQGAIDLEASKEAVHNENAAGAVPDQAPQPPTSFNPPPEMTENSTANFYEAPYPAGEQPVSMPEPQEHH